MFDPKKYLKNRKAHKRGQEDVPVVFHPKGSEPLMYTNREGEEKEYPNALGKHHIQVGTKLTPANRKQARAAGDFYRKPEPRQPEKPAPNLSNKQRFEARDTARKAARKAKANG